MKLKLKNLNQALTYHLEGMYDAEKKIQKAIPSLVKRVSSSTLKTELKKYLESAADKRTKLKRVFSYLLAGPFRRKNKAVDKMLEDLGNIISAEVPKELKDVLIIGSLQAINHFKISSYGTARALSEALELTTAAELLGQMLQWEKDTDRSLSLIAAREVNGKACKV